MSTSDWTDGLAEAWQDAQSLSRAYELNDNGDVTITTAVEGNILYHNGTKWVNSSTISGLTFTGDLIPSTDSSYDLGATAVRWANLYVDDIDVTANIVVGGTVDGRDVATDGTKLDTIETSADVTDATNVAAAGALMSGTAVIDDLDDVTITSVAHDDVIIYDTVTGGWINDTIAGGGGGSGDMVLADVQTVTGAKTFDSGTLIYAGATSGTTTLNATAVAGTTTLTLPAATDTLVGKATTDTFTNKSGAISQWTNDSGYITATLTTEQVQDIAGGMATGNTETLITVTYQDGDGTMDYVVDNDLSNYSNATSGFITSITGENLADLSDVTITTIANGEILKYNGAGYINNTLAEAGISATGHTHTESDITDLGAYLTSISGLAPDTATTAAAQPNITSLGTLTALQVDNLNINGNTLSSTAGVDLLITPLAGQQLVLDGTIVVDAGVVTGATSITSTSFVGDLTGNADTVTTNANLTGDVTSSGNATTIAAGAVDLAMLSATGTPTGSNFLRGDNTWATPAGSGDMVLADVQTVTGAKTFNSGKLIYAGATSGTTTVNATAVAGTTTLTLPAATDTLVGKATTDTLTNKTINTASNTITVVEADISDLGAYITASSTETLTNKSGAISQWTNDSSYLTGITGEPLADLSDVVITTIASGEILKYDGVNYINNTLAEAGISATGHSHTVSDITDLTNGVEALTTAEVDQLENIGATVISAADWTAVSNLSGTNSGDEAAASVTVSGIVELAIASEVDTGTDATRAVTPDALAGSDFGIRYMQAVLFDFTTDTATGNGKFYMHIPAGMDGMNLVYVHAEVITAGTTGTTDIQIHNVDNALDMLSTKLTIDSAETGSDTAATAAVINASNDHVNTNDVIRIDVDAVSTTAAKGLIITTGYQLP